MLVPPVREIMRDRELVREILKARELNRMICEDVQDSLDRDTDSNIYTYIDSDINDTDNPDKDNLDTDNIITVIVNCFTYYFKYLKYYFIRSGDPMASPSVVDTLPYFYFLQGFFFLRYKI